MQKKIGLYWFTNDLRVHDNHLLDMASEQVDSLICVYCYPKVTPFLGHFSHEAKLGETKRQFINEALHCLNLSLNNYGQCLLVKYHSTHSELRDIINAESVTHLFIEHQPGCDEQRIVEKLIVDFPNLKVCQLETRTLFTQSQLPFELSNLPSSFTQFRKQVEQLKIEHPLKPVSKLPPPPASVEIGPLKIDLSLEPSLFDGGEVAGLQHCESYFGSHLASHYKETRNNLDGVEYSTKFSPWLAHGCLSPKVIHAKLKQYEKNNGSNDSTYWIYFELLWREYFYWYARRYGTQLFKFSGIRTLKPLASFYVHRYQQWKQGQTPFPIVNACMKQLRKTGYMSNRGRQLAASCLIHELGLDWRYGAAYFESQLIDYDVASNWGNWQYLAGVGADPRGSRQFNLEKQTEIYDPQLVFINQWDGHADTLQLDNVDMVDWPIIIEHRQTEGD